MILTVRGTHGSGKSTVVRRVLEHYKEKRELRVEGKKRPVGYICKSPGMVSIMIPGQYETPAGGCDGLSPVTAIYGPIVQAADSGLSVLFEGIVAQHSTGRVLDLHKTHPVTIIVLSTPLEECIRSVELRRMARGNLEPFNPKNVKKEFEVAIRAEKRALAAGIEVLKLDRESAYQTCISKLTIGAMRLRVYIVAGEGGPEHDVATVKSFAGATAKVAEMETRWHAEMELLDPQSDAWAAKPIVLRKWEGRDAYAEDLISGITYFDDNDTWRVCPQ